MSVRTTLAATSRMARMDKSRATAREFDGDQQLLQVIKKADVFHSETHSNVELWEPIGHTAIGLKQKEESKQKQSAKQGQQERWNHDQPKGEASELLMLYLNGSRAHAVGMATDRRVRPYEMKEGRSATYAPDGSEQMLYLQQSGAFLVSLDGKSVEEPNGNKTRMASLRHVNKKMQTHKIDENKQQQQSEYKHEGETVNTEVRCIKDRIEFRAGNKVVGYYEVSSDTWYFTGKLIHNEATEELRDNAPTHNRSGDHIKDSAGRIDHN